MTTGSDAYMEIHGRKVCAFTYENGDYCGRQYPHDGPHDKPSPEPARIMPLEGEIGHPFDGYNCVACLNPLGNEGRKVAGYHDICVPPPFRHLLGE